MLCMATNAEICRTAARKLVRYKIKLAENRSCLRNPWRKRCGGRLQAIAHPAT
jgi:hypothetical protein